MDIVLGIVGAVVGGWLVGILGFQAGGFIRRSSWLSSEPFS
jgi:uncharacterized membrane protein YeaQ/YmgE (transglycosylase-associated protein family)